MLRPARQVEVEASAAAASTPRASVSRALDILDLFVAEDPAWGVERICAALGLSAPTGYRYIRELVSAGLLARMAGGLYALGPRIILLDYTIRQADPLLRIAVPAMRELVQRTGCDCVLSALFGDQILDTHREAGAEPLSLAYGRGRPRPMFRGAAPKVILAAQAPARLKKLFADHGDEIAAANLGADWLNFRRSMGEIKRRGFHISRGELEQNLCAIAVPVSIGPQESNAGLALVISVQRFEILNHELLVKLLKQTVDHIDGEMARC